MRKLAAVLLFALAAQCQTTKTQQVYADYVARRAGPRSYSRPRSY